MAIVTETDVATIANIETQCREAMGRSGGLATLMHEVYDRVRLDRPLNDGTDFSDIVAKYTPLYDARLSALKAIVEALPRWDQV